MPAKVLLAEDDNNLREIYQARLTAEGYEVIAAQNGEEALVMAKQHHPDLVISDVMMPRISGFEMLDILRNTDELKHTKVIMLTALGQADDRGRADNLGADKYLVKSQVTLEDIISSAHEILEGTATGVVQPQAADPVVSPVADLPVADVPVDAPVASQVPVAPAPVDPSPVVQDVPVAAEPAVAVAVDTTAPVDDVTSAPVEPVAPVDTDVADEADLHIPEPTEPVVPVPSMESAEATVEQSAPESIEAEEQALQEEITNLVAQEPVQATPDAPVDVAVPVEPAEVPDMELPTVEAPVAVEPVLPQPEAEAAPQVEQLSAESTAPVHQETVVQPIAEPATPQVPIAEAAAEGGEQDDEPMQPAAPRVINPDINNIAL